MKQNNKLGIIVAIAYLASWHFASAASSIVLNPTPYVSHTGSVQHYCIGQSVTAQYQGDPISPVKAPGCCNLDGTQGTWNTTPTSTTYNWSGSVVNPTNSATATVDTSQAATVSVTCKVTWNWTASCGATTTTTDTATSGSVAVKPNSNNTCTPTAPTGRNVGVANNINVNHYQYSEYKSFFPVIIWNHDISGTYNNIKGTDSYSVNGALVGPSPCGRALTGPAGGGTNWTINWKVSATLTAPGGVASGTAEVGGSYTSTSPTYTDVFSGQAPDTDFVSWYGQQYDQNVTAKTGDFQGQDTITVQSGDDFLAPVTDNLAAQGAALTCSPVVNAEFGAVCSVPCCPSN